MVVVFIVKKKNSRPKVHYGQIMYSSKSISMQNILYLNDDLLLNL